MELLYWRPQGEAVRRACWWNSLLKAARWRQREGRADGTPVLVAAGRRLWEGCADEALTPMVTRQRAVEWMRCQSLHPVSKEGKRIAVLESVGRQDKNDKMVDSLETEAWLMQYQLLWPWITQCQLLWPAQSKSRGLKKKKKNTKTSIRKNEKERRCPLRLKKKKEEERNGAQFPLTHKTLSPFIGGALARNPCNL